VPALAAVPSQAFDVVDFLAMPRSARRPARRTLRFAGLLVSLAPKAAADVLASLRASRAEIQTVVALVYAWRRYGQAIEDRLQEGCKLGFAHLAAAHRELAMVNATEAATWGRGARG
jgi:hypothetical protein